jgi:hypothetical protein
VPAVHTTAVALVEPAGHAYPGLHDPEHEALVRPATAPYVPGGHWAVQAAVVRPVAAP